jgi:hypothetical protein
MALLRNPSTGASHQASYVKRQPAFLESREDDLRWLVGSCLLKAGWIAVAQVMNGPAHPAFSSRAETLPLWLAGHRGVGRLH